MVSKVIVTVELSFEHSLKQDIRDYLFLIDRNINIRGTVFRGVLLIETTRDSRDIASILINSPIPNNALTTIVPIIDEGNYNNLNDIINMVSRNLGSGCRSFIVRCRLRNSPISDDSCERAIINFLRNKGVHAVFRGESDCAVVVEGLDNWAGIYVGSRVYVRV
ncbi:MAG: hypothetical protein AT717_06990 [Vulcanisaeta sp. CIS_19]|jgi:hypothetical protein|nr:MAG: hypothetical protein AT717_06990 [Vulcanisaeta sp. CIS_19]